MGARRHEPSFQRGDRLGRWQLIEKLGEGGNGVVWRAIHGTEEAAVKVLKGTSRYLQERFRREVGALERFRNDPGVLPILDSHVPVRLTPSAPAFFAMPLATPMPALLGKAELEDLDQALKCFLSIARTLERLHRASYAHRDIKPENLFLLDGRWVIGDFGLVAVPDAATFTKPGHKLGPLYFIAPEMLEHADAADSPRADVYSWAKVVYVVVTGQQFPPPGAHRTDDPYTTVATYVSDPRSPSIDALLARCTVNRADARPSMSEVVAELEAIMKDTPPEGTNVPDMRSALARIEAINASRKSTANRVSQIEKTLLALIGSRYELKFTFLSELEGSLSNSMVVKSSWGGWNKNSLPWELHFGRGTGLPPNAIGPLGRCLVAVADRTTGATAFAAGITAVALGDNFDFQVAAAIGLRRRGEPYFSRLWSDVTAVYEPSAQTEGQMAELARRMAEALPVALGSLSEALSEAAE